MCMQSPSFLFFHHEGPRDHQTWQPAHFPDEPPFRHIELLNMWLILLSSKSSRFIRAYKTSDFFPSLSFEIGVLPLAQLCS